MSSLLNFHSDNDTLIQFTRDLIAFQWPEVHVAAAAEFEDVVSLLPQSLRSGLSVKRFVVCICTSLKRKNAKYMDEIVWSMIGDLHRIRHEPGYSGGAFMLLASTKRMPSGLADP